MDRYQQRHRRRQFFDDSTDLRRLSLTSSFKNSDSDDDYLLRYQRRKEYCLVRIIYRKSDEQRRRRFDEITVIENHRTVYKGCLCEGDEFTVKCQRYENQSKIKLKFYINDLLDDEIISCCAYGLIHRNRSKHLFHIEEVIGAKPCYDCEFNENLLKTTNSTVPKIPVLQRQKSISDDEATDNVPPIVQTTKRTYGPPQLSNLLSITESIDLSSDLVRTSLPPSPSDRTNQLFNSEITTNQGESTQTSTNATNQSDTIVSFNTNNSGSGGIPLADAAVQLLLSRLGIIRQEQIEHPEPSIVNRSRERGNVEYCNIIYLDETNPDESVIQHLRSLVNFVKTFNDIDDCIAFINTVLVEKLILIISHTFYQSILPRIEDLHQIISIYILSDDNEQTTTDTKQSKIKGFYTDINEIYKSIAFDVERVSIDSTFYLITSSRATAIEPSVVYHFLLNEILLEKPTEKYQLNDLISLARREYEGNEYELEIIDEFEKTYKKNQAISWYLRSCFLSKMLNKAILVPEPDMLYYYRFFIQDLFEQIQNEATDDIRFVYFGQTIQRDELDRLETDIQTNDIIVLPQYLLGTTDQEYATELAHQLPIHSDEFMPILVSLEIPEEFKCIRQIVNENNNKILVNLNLMYRLIKIEKKQSISTVFLRLIKSEEERNIQDIFDITRKEVKSLSIFVSLIKLMIVNNQHISAEQFAKFSFNDETRKEDEDFQASIALAAHLLATSRRNQDNYQLALDNYLLSLESFQRFMPPKSVELAAVHSSIGTMYFRLENYPQSLEHFLKALESQLHAATPDLLAISIYTKSLGTIYAKLDNFPAAINAFLRTIRVLEQCPETNYTELMATYDELGDVYYRDNKIDEALKNYVKAVECQENIIPRNLESLGKSYHTIGNLFLKNARSKEALKYLKQALEYFQQILPAEHASFALLNNNIGLMYYREEQYEDALQYYGKALDIAAVSLPENHSLVGITWFNVALVYTIQEKFDQAIESIEKSTQQFLKTLPEDHADVVENQKYLETIRQKKALKEIFDGNITSF